MKRKAILFASALACVVMAGNLFASHASSAINTNIRVLVNYTWYMDPDETIPNGAHSDVATELNRLRSTYPSNTFSTSPSGGLHGYEWGTYPGFPDAIIYSNK